MLKENLIKNRRPLGISMLLIALLLFSISDASNSIGKVFANQKILTENAQYLEASAKESEKNVLKLTEIFAVLKTFQSTEIGISLIVKLQVEVGQAVAAFSIMVEKGIAISIASSAAAHTLIVIDKIAGFLTPWLFKLSLFVVAAFLILYSFNRKHYVTEVSQLAAELVVVLLLTTHLIIPYTIHLNGWLATEVTAGLTKESQTKLTDLHAHVTSSHGKTSLKKRAEHAAKALETIIVDIGKKVEVVTSYAIRHTVAAVIEGLIMPLAIFLALFALVRRFAVHAREQVIKLRELEPLVEK